MALISFFPFILFLVPFEFNIEMTIFLTTELKFDISFKIITWKNTLLNSKNVVIQFARLFRPWVVFWPELFGPELFQF